MAFFFRTAKEPVEQGGDRKGCYQAKCYKSLHDLESLNKFIYRTVCML